jgi:dihydrofolate reductase
MRKVVLSFWISLDGYSVDEDTGLWQVLEGTDDQQHEEHFVGWLRQAGTHIMGRVTYQEMAKAWPTSSEAVAAPMNEIPKVVFSGTLESADWPQTRIASGDTAEEIAKLKAEPGGDIIAHGGTTFVRSLIRLGLIDEYRLTTLPAAAGKGAALFAGLDSPRMLCLLSSTAFPSGIVELRYAPADPRS